MILLCRCSPLKNGVNYIGVKDPLLPVSFLPTVLVNYIGVTENSFKDRLYKHRNSFKHENKINSTELSKHIWVLKKQGITNPVIKWSIIDYAKPYINGSKRCNLCLTEKYHIINSPLKLLNKRSELVSKCRHENKYYFNNYKIPPDIS